MDSVYLWVLRKSQAQDTVFMNDFSQFLHKKNLVNIVLYLSLKEDPSSPEETYFQAKRVSGFLSEQLVPNTLFHLHQWGIMHYQDTDYVLNIEKLSKVFTLSSTVVLTNVWKENLLELSEILHALRDVPIIKGVVFTNNPHLNIHTQDYTQVSHYPDEKETAQLSAQMSSFVETWVSHLNNFSKLL